MKLCTRLAVLAVTVSGPAFAQEAQIPTHLEQRLGAAAAIEIGAPASAALAGADHALQAAREREVSARVSAALTPPVRLGAVIARRASATTELSAQGGRRVLYAAK